MRGRLYYTNDPNTVQWPRLDNNYDNKNNNNNNTNNSLSNTKKHSMSFAKCLCTLCLKKCLKYICQQPGQITVVVNILNIHRKSKIKIEILIVANFVLSLALKEFWKSINISRSYWQEYGVLFFYSHCITGSLSDAGGCKWKFSHHFIFTYSD